MPKIACILPKSEGFSPSHAGAIALCIRDNIEHSRYKNDTYVIGGATQQGFDGIEYYVTQVPRWYERSSRSYVRNCVRILKENMPDLVEVHNRPMIALEIANQMPRMAIAVHVHNDPQTMRGARTPRERMILLGHCKAIYCVSEYVRSQFLQGLPPEAAAQVHVVYNGLAMPEHMPPKEKIIVFVGRMTPEKGALPLAQALAHVLPDFPEWKAVFIGSKRHATEDAVLPFEQSVMAALEPVAMQTECTGFISHDKTMDYMKRAEIAVVPSLWNEPFGRTALEALASQCALISSDRGGLKEVIGSAALIPSDITQMHLAESLCELLSDAAKRHEMQQAGPRQAEHFLIAQTTRTLDDIRGAIIAYSARLPVNFLYKAL